MSQHSIGHCMGLGMAPVTGKLTQLLAVVLAGSFLHLMDCEAELTGQILTTTTTVAPPTRTCARVSPLFHHRLSSRHTFFTRGLLSEFGQIKR